MADQGAAPETSPPSGRRLRVLYATQWFDPEPVLKGLSFARALKLRGCDIRVVTGIPNYPSGRVYAGYRIRALQRQVVDGIEVDRVPLYPSHSRSAFGRVLNYVSFACCLTVYGLLTRRTYDVIYVYHPPITVGLAAAVIGLFRRVRFIYDIQDIWPDTLAATGMVGRRPIIGLVHRMCRFVYRRAARILVLSPGFRRLLVERGVPDARIGLVYNWADEAAVASQSASDLAPYGFDGRFNIVFAGSMGPAQGLDVVIDAAKVLAGRDQRIQFVLVGSGIDADRLRARVADEAVANVRIMPPVERNAIAGVLARADVLLVSLRDDPLFAITIPSKTQFYMAMGKPILMTARGDAADLVQAAECGVCVPPGDVTAFTHAVLELAVTSREALAEMGRRGRASYSATMSFDAGIDLTMDALHSVTKRRRATG